jgi:hypothetical protein
MGSGASAAKRDAKAAAEAPPPTEVTTATPLASEGALRWHLKQLYAQTPEASPESSPEGSRATSLTAFELLETVLREEDSRKEAAAAAALWADSEAQDAGAPSRDPALEDLDPDPTNDHELHSYLQRIVRCVSLEAFTKRVMGPTSSSSGSGSDSSVVSIVGSDGAWTRAFKRASSHDLPWRGRAAPNPEHEWPPDEEAFLETLVTKVGRHS